ncbi:hypothetical protein C5167_007626 [Papaver somniferum]|uniref:uncharacterized protein At2g39795, mitochondrial-like n=1 Tax=Papaver somniferum TaxID=3469 RepID=UPI000E6FE3F4|nr:uncharacterized protein At2g39795, mitochondrial-like [Papaver somniferum]RZC93587.1 hypothetical protein C5167_007626 [Papaver somniferum]
MATLSRIIKKAASSLIQLSNRTVHQKNYSSSIFTTPLKSCISSRKMFPRAAIPALNFSSQAKKKPSSDISLLSFLDNEIQCALESDDHEVVEAPGGFPFKIEDNPGEQTITLTREYQGEDIKVIVHMNNLVTGEDGEVDHEDDDQAEGGVSSPQSSVPLVVTVSKGSGPTLEFSVMAYPDEISIDSMTVKQPNASGELIPYEGPDFAELDENLQKAFHKYLEIRGIKPKTTNFLHEYMINKDSREYLNWLKELKAFVAK